MRLEINQEEIEILDNGLVRINKRKAHGPFQRIVSLLSSDQRKALDFCQSFLKKD